MESLEMLLRVFVFVVAVVATTAASSDGGVEACVPGDARCDAAGSVLRVCLQDGRWAHLLPQMECEGAGCDEAPCSQSSLPRTSFTCTAAEQGVTRCAADCSGTEVCLVTGTSGTWLSVACQSGTLCNKDGVDAKCEASTQRCKSGNEIVCGSPGLYPAKECEDYYVCDDSGSIYGQLHQCEEGKSFNPSKGKCVIKKNKCCSDTDSKCRTGSESLSTIIDNVNPALFALCLERTLTWYRCEEGQIYSDGKCKEDSGSSSDSPPPSICDVCQTPGNYGVTGNTCIYIVCYSTTSCKEVTCPSGYHFDQSTRKCVVGNC